MVLATRASLTQSIRSVFAGARICPRPGSAVRPFVKAPDTMLKRRKLEAPESPTHALIDDAEVILSHSLGDSFKVPGLVCTDHQFTVPLDHSGEVEGELDLFVREVVTPNNVNRRDLPYLLYLQGERRGLAPEVPVARLAFPSPSRLLHRHQSVPTCQLHHLAGKSCALQHALRPYNL